MKKACLYLPVLLFLAVFPSLLCAQTMSELNLKEFDKEPFDLDIKQQNPFAPTRTFSHDLTEEDLFLTGTAVGTYDSYALISGHVVKEGGSIAGLTVKSIGRNQVVLQHLDRVIKLNLAGGM